MKTRWVLAGLMVLLVAEPAVAGNMTVSADGLTVIDSQSGLVWQRQDDGVGRDWGAALGYCEALNLANRTDWRLPTVKELESITDDSHVNPAIDPAFTGTRASGYWSSTTVANDRPQNAWNVFLNNGYVGGEDKSNPNFYVRCVRGGQ